MKPIVRNILLALSVVLTAGVMIVGLVWTRHQTPSLTCQHLFIEIKDADERDYIHPSDVVTYLKQRQLFPEGKNLELVETQVIEDAIKTHPIIESAECYETNLGDVYLVLTQRQPLLRVITASDSYFIDTNRRRMPILPSIHSDVLVAEGHVGQRMAQEELADLVEWINQQGYWRQRITKIEVREGLQVVLRQGRDAPLILLGDISRYKQKMKKLRTFMESIPQEMEVPAYKELDIRFNGQVVGRK